MPCPRAVSVTASSTHAYGVSGASIQINPHEAYPTGSPSSIAMRRSSPGSKSNEASRNATARSHSGCVA